MNDKVLGDGPIEEQHYKAMNAVAAGLDEIFNGDKRGNDRGVGFVLMIFPYGPVADDSARCNYISNGADRKDIVALMKEMIQRFTE